VAEIMAELVAQAEAALGRADAGPLAAVGG
jgi:hypothetical protein